jgi:hypothetical protein
MLRLGAAATRLVTLAALAVAVPLAAFRASPAAATEPDPAPSRGRLVGAPEAADEIKLTAADGVHGDLFGSSVVLDGDTALVGAWGVDVNGNMDQGAAYVFSRVGGGWVQQQKLLASDGAPLDEFGTAVALAGDTALVGSTDGAYVFVREAGVWAQQAKLDRADPLGNDFLGATLGLSGDGRTAVVGAWGTDVDGNVNQGTAFVFTRDQGQWTEQAQLTASDPHEWAVFGSDVAVSPDGQRIVVGAELGHVGSTQFQGKAYVFVRDGESWAEEAILTASDGVANDRFGGGVAIAGDTVLVGAYEAQGRGAAYVFGRDGSEWTAQATLHGSGNTAGGWFGHRVALSADGNIAVVGARHSRESLGSAYVFTDAGGDWREQAMLTASDEGGNHQFGSAVAVDGDTALIGAYTSWVGEVVNQGAAYSYELGLVGPDPEPVCDQTITGVHVGPVTAADGVVCLAAGARVFGEVNVHAGAGLIATAAVVQGPISAVGAELVRLTFSQVTGPVLISRATGEVSLLGNQVTGSVSLVAIDTTAAATVSGNTVIGSVTCVANSPAPTDHGLPNTATAGKFGQCADL